MLRRQMRERERAKRGALFPSFKNENRIFSEQKYELYLPIAYKKMGNKNIVGTNKRQSRERGLRHEVRERKIDKRIKMEARTNEQTIDR